jgi:hypothetical protein
MYDCALNYFYYVPCPTYSWFWAFTGWEPGDIIGSFFNIGDVSMFFGEGQSVCDPYNCMDLDGFRVLDFAGYGTTYPGLFTVEFDVYCSDAQGCPLGPSMWNSGPVETHFGWNYFWIEPALCVVDCVCSVEPRAYPRILLTATMTGDNGVYPAWGFDNISQALDEGCLMHDYGCATALYPRPSNSHYPIMHSGYYGNGQISCPPAWFCDGNDQTPECNEYGFVELAWRVLLTCAGPSATEPSTWGKIKRIYR